MKIVEDKRTKQISYHPNFMRIGDVGRVLDYALGKTKYILRTYYGYIDLVDPHNTWANLSDVKVQVVAVDAEVHIKERT